MWANHCKQQIPLFVILINVALLCTTFSTLTSYASGDDKNLAETSLERTKELIKESKYKEALSLLSPFISKPMEYPIIVSDYLAILVWYGRYDDAISLYENLPSSFPRRAYLMRNIAKAYYEKKEFVKAFSLYQAALEETPLDEEAQKGLVLSLISLKEYGKALESLEKFLEKSSGSVFLALTKADLLLRQGNYLESLKLYHALASRKDVEDEYVYKIRDDLITFLPVEKRLTMLSELQVAAQKDEIARSDYLLVLILNKEYEMAIKVFETAALSLEYYPDYLLSWIAWAYFKKGDTEKAKFYYLRVLNSRPDYARANIGLAYCLSAEGQEIKAIEILDNLQRAEPDNLEIRFARAFLYEKSKKIWSAIQEYDRILEISPGNPIALKLKLQDLSDMGASTLALQEACSNLPHDKQLLDSIKGDMAVDRIHWKEPAVAMSILLPLLEDRENIRTRYDYIVALAEDSDMEKAIKAYEDLIKEGIFPPPWVLENVAKAYLYLEQPYKALELYDKALEEDPASFEGRRGKFYTLQELRRWKEAREVLNVLDRELPEVLGTGDSVRPNWPKLQIAIDRGWFLAYEERYRDAQEYFWNLYEAAPANAGIRTGLAHVYLWRGWPRKALREFNIIETLEPENYKALIGKAIALNELAFKEDARDLAKKLLIAHPKDKHVQRLNRLLEVEEMAELTTDFAFVRDEDGFQDISAGITLSKPISLYTTLYASTLWQQSSDEVDTRFYRRSGLGIRHIFNSSWSIIQQFSMDYDNGDDFGSLTVINFSPDDYWRFSLSYDSFTTDVPLRARVFGIDSDKFETSITYRESEWRSYHLTLSRLKFSDGNRKEQALLDYEQCLFVKNNWKMRIFLDLYTSRNSREDAPYFNPDHDLNLSVTHMTEQTLWRIYEKAFVHKLFLTAGMYKQSDFANQAIWSIRYQQEHDFSDTHALLWGIAFSRRVYDGNPTHEYGLYLTYTWRF